MAKPKGSQMNWAAIYDCRAAIAKSCSYWEPVRSREVCFCLVLMSLNKSNLAYRHSAGGSAIPKKWGSRVQCNTLRVQPSFEYCSLHISQHYKLFVDLKVTQLWILGQTASSIRILLNTHSYQPESLRTLSGRVTELITKWRTQRLGGEKCRLTPKSDWITTNFAISYCQFHTRESTRIGWSGNCQATRMSGIWKVCRSASWRVFPNIKPWRSACIRSRETRHMCFSSGFPRGGNSTPDRHSLYPWNLLRLI